MEKFNESVRKYKRFVDINAAGDEELASEKLRDAGTDLYQSCEWALKNCLYKAAITRFECGEISAEEKGSEIDFLSKKDTNLYKLDQLLFGKDNKYSSYLYAVYKEYIELIKYEEPEVSKYTALNRLVKERTAYVRKKADNIKTDLVKKELKKINEEYPIKDIMGQNFYSIATLVITNSCELQRQCINSILSILMQIEISDDVVLQKKNNRKITYSELRILTYLRNNNFSLEDFEKDKEDFVRDEFQYAIDYSIIQV